MTELEDISGKNLNNDNLGGIHHTIYAIEHDKVSGIDWPDMNGLQGLNDNNIVSLAGITFEPGALVKIKSVQYKGDLNGNTEGPFGSKAKKSVLVYMLATNNRQHLGFDRAIQNSDLVFFVKDNHNQIRVFGSDRFPAKLDTGASTTQPEPGAGDVGIIHTFNTFGPGEPLVLVNGTAPNFTLADFEDLETAAAYGSGSGS
jgi:hypothetical protein